MPCLPILFVLPLLRARRRRADRLQQHLRLPGVDWRRRPSGMSPLTRARSRRRSPLCEIGHARRIAAKVWQLPGEKRARDPL